MKKILLGVVVFVFSIISTSVASPIPFEVGPNGFLSPNTSGLLIGTQQTLTSGPFYLEEGKTTPEIDFFEVWLPLAWAEGTVEAYIELLSPTPSENLTQTGDFSVLALGFFSSGWLHWEEPEQIPYSYGGMSGGLLTLDLIDIDIGFQFGTSFTISGTIRNDQNPVPEPATMLLLGTGLVGLAGIGRRKFFKKS